MAIRLVKFFPLLLGFRKSSIQSGKSARTTFKNSDQWSTVRGSTITESVRAPSVVETGSVSIPNQPRLRACALLWITLKRSRPAINVLILDIILVFGVMSSECTGFRTILQCKLVLVLHFIGSRNKLYLMARQKKKRVSNIRADSLDDH